MTNEDIKFKIGETAYLRSDIDQRERFVTAVLVRQNHFMYELSFGSESSFHYGFEISKKRDTLKAMS